MNIPDVSPLALLRWVPSRAPTGLFAVGRPGRDAPVLLTGNYTLTLRRVRRALRGRDAWLLVAQSQGINVWCAAGGGHLTHHEIISALRTSGVAEAVDHRDVVLPQLCATGVDRRRVEAVTGWNLRWGPAHAEDLPAWLDHGRRVRKEERKVRFPLSERLEMAAGWFLPMAAVALAVVGLLAGWRAGVVAAASLAVPTFGIFAALPRLRLAGRTALAAYAAGGLGALALGELALRLPGFGSSSARLAVAIAALAGAALLSIDLPGTTPWYPSTINTLGETFRIDLVEERCTAAADCVLVCPRDVLDMDGPRHKVRIARPDDCIRCGACIVQCPRDALRFRYDDGRVVEPATLRSTRMNLLGKRTVAVR